MDIYIAHFFVYFKNTDQRICSSVTILSNSRARKAKAGKETEVSTSPGDRGLLAAALKLNILQKKVLDRTTVSGVWNRLLIYCLEIFYF